jgi:hypothetical protein
MFTAHPAGTHPALVERTAEHEAKPQRPPTIMPNGENQNRRGQHDQDNRVFFFFFSKKKIQHSNTEQQNNLFSFFFLEWSGHDNVQDSQPIKYSSRRNRILSAIMSQSKSVAAS